MLCDGQIALYQPDADIRQVSDALTDLVEAYSVIEVRFPIGYEMEDSVASGEAYIDKLRKHAKATYARDITRRGGSSDLTDLLSTLSEMKRFLLHYAAYADISIKGDAPLKPGDTVLLIPSGTSAPTSAQPASLGEDLEDGRRPIGFGRPGQRQCCSGHGDPRRYR